jgi:hypothetical protein
MTELWWVDEIQAWSDLTPESSFTHWRPIPNPPGAI